MKFEVKKPVLESVLSKAASVLSPKDLLPILQNFSVSVSPDLLRVVATDLELSVIAKTALVECHVAGHVVLPGRKLIDIVKTCEDAPVLIEVVDDTATVKCAEAWWTIDLMDAGDYPTVPDIDKAELLDVNRFELAMALHRVKGAAAKEGVRPALQMVDVYNGNIRASDGAIFRQVHVEDLVGMDMQIPLGAVDDLVKLLKSTEAEHVKVGQTEDHLLFIVGGDVFLITKNNVDYPDVENTLLVPARQNSTRIGVDRQQLINGVKRMRVNADEDTKGVSLSLTTNRLHIRSRNKYGEEGGQDMEVQYIGSPRDIAINHENLVDALQAVDSPMVNIMLGEDTHIRKAPIFIEDGNVVAVLQQLKLNI